MRGQCCTITVLQMNRFNETEAASFVSLMCFCFQKIFIQNLSYVAMCMKINSKVLMD